MKYQVSLNLKSFNPKFLNIINNSIIKFSEFNSIQFEGPVRLPSKLRKITVLKAPNINKKAREQFEIQVNKSYFIFKLNNIKIYKKLILFLLKEKKINNFIQLKLSLKHNDLAV